MKPRRLLDDSLEAFGVWLFVAVCVGALIGYGATIAGIVAGLR